MELMHINPITFWGICLVAAMGLVRALIDVLRPNKDEEEGQEWKKAALKEQAQAAPDGFTWILVKKEDLPPK